MTLDGTPGAQVRLGVMTTDTPRGYELFRDDIRAQNIHVGLGYTGDVAHCATCDEPWPCPTASGRPDKWGGS